MNNFFVKQLMALLAAYNTGWSWIDPAIHFTTPRGYSATVNMETHDLTIFGGGVTLRRHSHDNTDDLIATIQEMFWNPTHWKFN